MRTIKYFFNQLKHDIKSYIGIYDPEDYKVSELISQEDFKEAIALINEGHYIDDNAVYEAINKKDGYLLVSILLKNGAKFDDFTVIEAVSNGKYDIADMLLRANGGKIGDLSIISAINSSDLEALKYFIQNNAVIEDSDIYNAARYYFRNPTSSQEHILKYLVEQVGDIVDPRVINCAVSANDKEMLDYFFKHNAVIDDKAVYIATVNNNFDMVRILVEKGAEITHWEEPIKNIEITDIFPLLDSHFGRKDFYQLKYYKLMNKHGHFSKSAVSQAVMNDNVEMVKYLVENGGKVSPEDVYKALSNDNCELAKYLTNPSNFALEKVKDMEISETVSFTADNSQLECNGQNSLCNNNEFHQE